MEKHRIPYFDCLRGLAIIMVIGIHTVPSWIYPLDNLTCYLAVFIRQSLNCAVPIFLALSGYFVSKSNVSTVKSYYSFLKKHIPGVYIPCLIFSSIWLCLIIWSGEPITLRLIFLYLFCGLSVYYFIALIIQYYILLPVLKNFNLYSGRSFLILSSLISFASSLVVTYLMHVRGVHLSFMGYAGTFPLNLIFFCVGVYFSNHKRDFSLFGPLLVLVVGLFLQMIEYKFWLDHGQVVLGVNPSSMIYSFGVVWLMLSDKVEKMYKHNILNLFLNKVGNISFGIYLTHMFVLIYIPSQLASSWFLKWFGVLFLSIIIITIIKKIIPNFSKTYLGFRG